MKSTGRPKEAIESPVPLMMIRPEIEAALIEGQNQQLAASEKAKIFSAGRNVGQMDSFEFVIAMSEAGLLNRYEAVKKDKSWQYMPNPEATDGRFFRSFDEYCQIGLKMSYRRLQDLSSTRKLIGVAAYEKAEKMGLRQVDYNAIKALPAPDQELISRALQEDQTRDDVLGLLQELAARHAKETESFKAELKKATEDIESKDRLIANKNLMIDQQAEQLQRKFVPSPESAAKNEHELTLLNEINQAACAADLAIRRLFVAVDAAIDGPDAISLAARQAIEYMAQQYVDIANKFSIKVDFENRLNPPWMTDEMLTQIKTREVEFEAEKVAALDAKKANLAAALEAKRNQQANSPIFTR